MSDATTITVRVRRYHPEHDAAPVVRDYRVPFAPDWSVLQALQYIKDEIDGTLTFRWSCRMAICGSCGMMIDGRPALACRTFLRDCNPAGVEVSSLAHFPVERDLVAVLDGFVEKLSRVKAYLIPKREAIPGAGENLQTPAELDRYRPLSACINCQLCYAACPQFGLEPKFLGPGAIALAHRYNEDSRDAGKNARLDVLRGDHGVFDCTAVGYCSVVCPMQVDPAHAVNSNKARAAASWLSGAFAKRGARS